MIRHMLNACLVARITAKNHDQSIIQNVFSRGGRIGRPQLDCVKHARRLSAYLKNRVSWKKCCFVPLCIVFLSTTAYAQTPQRIITIGGAITEMVFQLDAGDAVIANDTSSYYPEAANQLPKVGYQRTLSAEGIASLNPDLVLLTNEAGPPPVLKQLETAGIRIETLTAGRSVDDVTTSIRTIGTLLNRSGKASELIEHITTQHQQILERNAQINQPKTLLFLLTHGGTPMAAGKGTAASQIIALAGGRNTVTAYEGYKPLGPESAVALNPGIILLTTQGLEQLGGSERIKTLPGIGQTQAAREGNIIAMDSLLLLGFGPRTIDAALELHQAIYPQP